MYLPCKTSNSDEICKHSRLSIPYQQNFKKLEAPHEGTNMALINLST